MNSNPLLARRKAHLANVLALLLPVGAGATNLNVPGTYATIQAAISAASAGETVLVAPGTYMPVTGNVALNFNGKAIVVTSSGGAQATTLNCAGTSAANQYAFLFQTNETSASVLSGFTIENGNQSQAYGGAIKIVDCSPTIEQCVFVNNVSGASGGAIYVSINSANITPSIKQCVFTNNTTGDLTTNSGFGGAVELVCNTNTNSISATISDCVFTGNMATYDGGAVDVGGFGNNLKLNLVNCSFYNNHAEGYVAADEVGLISPPTAGVSLPGGAIDFFEEAPCTLSNCIFYGDNYVSMGGSVTTSSEISTLNPPTVAGDVLQYSLFQNPYAGFGAGLGNLSGNPAYASAPGNLQLLSGSPAIGVGTATGAPSVDINNVSWNGHYDMGAYAPPVSHFSVSAPASVLSGTSLSFAVTALDQYNDTVVSYSGTVTFSSSDGSASLPAATTLTSGVGSFATTLRTGGDQTLTATGASGVNGTSAAILVIVPTATPTVTSSPTHTLSPTATSLVTSTPTSSPTITATFTSSATSTVTPTSTSTSTVTASFTSTSSPTITATFTSSATPSSTLTWTRTATVTASPTPTTSPIPSATFTHTATSTSTPTWTGTATVTFTPTLTPTVTSTFTITSTPTVTDSPTVTRTPTLTPTITATPPYNASKTGGLVLAPNVLRGGQSAVLLFDEPPSASSWWVYTLDGELEDHFTFAGTSRSFWNPAKAASGLYFVHVRVAYQNGGTRTQTFNVVVIH